MSVLGEAGIPDGDLISPSLFQENLYCLPHLAVLLLSTRVNMSLLDIDTCLMKQATATFKGFKT